MKQDIKKIYEKPICKVILLQHKTMLLVGSGGDPTPGVSWWDGEGNARRRRHDKWSDGWDE